MSTAPQAPAVWVFDRLHAGMTLGWHDDAIDAAALAAWQAIYGGPGPQDPGQPVPSGFAPVLVMRAYLAVVSPRPPGNIHRLLPRELPLRSTVRCVAREWRGPRRSLRFQVDCHRLDADARLLLTGELDLLWAA